MTNKLSQSGHGWLPRVSKTERKNRGSGMLVFMVAVTIGIVLGIIFFGLNFARLLGSGAEQKKAIEAAALAAANDLSRIVINTDQFGYVSISDAAPVGKTTEAGDNYYLQVRSINTLMGTARLEKMLAKAVTPVDPSDTLNYLADQDYINTKAVAANLEAKLVASLLPAGSGTDIDGNTVTPYADALAAYQQNSIRISGASTLVPNSLKLVLGQSKQPLATNIPVPVTKTFPGDVPATSQINSNYLSNVDIAFNGNDYVFMAIGSTSSLLDPKNFLTSLPGLPFQYPSIVEASAQQIVTQKNNQNPGGSTISSAACAEPGSIYDPLPAPGAMSFSFPDGIIKELTSPNSMLTNASLNSLALPADSSELYTSSGGDYPGDRPTAAMQPTPWIVPPNSPAPAIGVVYRVALFDWFRRAGTKAQLDSVLDKLATPFNPGTTPWIEWFAQSKASKKVDIGMTIPEGITYIYKFNANGTVKYSHAKITPFPYCSESQNQLFADSYTALVSTDPAFPKNSPPIKMLEKKGAGGGGVVTLTDNWDVFIRDECRVPGTNLGGKHAGEPLSNSIVAMAVPGDAIRLAFRDHGGSGSAASPKLILGGGNVPLLSDQGAWALSMEKFEVNNGAGSIYTVFPQGPLKGSIRPTYQTNGTAFDIRFRRQVNSSNASKALGFDTGYVADELLP